MIRISGNCMFVQPPHTGKCFQHWRLPIHRTRPEINKSRIQITAYFGTRVTTKARGYRAILLARCPTSAAKARGYRALWYPKRYQSARLPRIWCPSARLPRTLAPNLPPKRAVTAHLVLYHALWHPNRYQSARSPHNSTGNVPYKCCQRARLPRTLVPRALPKRAVTAHLVPMRRVTAHWGTQQTNDFVYKFRKVSQDTFGGRQLVRG